jgi:hypothetical protein
MERWGVPVPHSDEEEATELALSFDDAEFQHGPSTVGSGAAGSGAAGSGGVGSNGANDSDASDGTAGAEEHLSA